MNIKFKKTPVFFLSLLFIPLLAFGAFYFFLVENNGGMALAGAIYLFVFAITLLILIIEQLIVREFNALKKVWIVEIALILLIILFSIYFSD